MSINRIPYNALVDDAGTGGTGTPWNKQAIKDVLLDPIDAAILAVPAPVGAIYSGSGSSTSAAATNLVQVPIPALAMQDALELQADFWLAGPSPGPVVIDLYGAGVSAAVLITLTGATGGGDLTAFGIATFRVVMKPTPGFQGQFICSAYGAVIIGATQVRGFVFGTVPIIDGWTKPWTLYARQMTGLPAGTPLQWSLQVFARKGA